MKRNKYYNVGLFELIFSCIALFAYRFYKKHPKRAKEQGRKISISYASEIPLIDLGLPSGTLWADRNIGADTPEQVGDYFRFGETVPFTEDSPEYFYDGDVKDIEGTIKDAATVILGKDFKMPTLEQLKELLGYCTTEWTELNGTKGMKVTGSNGNSIFFPFSGFRSCDGSLYVVDLLHGCYWSASAYGRKCGYCLSFSSCGWRWGWNSYYRSFGYPVRAVAVKNMK